ncbi:MAG: cupin domain-containing protein [Longimicrobiales bacterium]
MTGPTPFPDGVIVRLPGEGRHYPCGPMDSVFLADGAESDRRYSASIWRVAPNSPGPGAHSHEANEELFFVVEGTMTFLVGDRYIDAPTGTFLRIPAGVRHDFENRTGERASALNIYMPGGFEDDMPAIVEWFRAREAQGPA